MIYYLVCILTFDVDGQNFDVYRYDNSKEAERNFLRKISLRDYRLISLRKSIQNKTLEKAQKDRKYFRWLDEKKGHSIFMWIQESENDNRHKFNLSDNFIESFPEPFDVLNND